ncbi:MAG: arabinan endo-1,5-alpha-L-arabinosidase [Bacteroidales bacterium]|nr:arabinan endo-1,5-alpha-L-arabinosidase [Bacteroidales bacterium]
MYTYHKTSLWLALAAAFALPLSSCDKDDDPSPDNGGGSGAASFSVPTYSDNYVDISSWADHNKWNLANVHDPSVAFFKGKYYMFGTDASYGNAHEGHGHFQGKSSTDLVNWSWNPGIFYDADRPTWILDSLNAIRSRMNLSQLAASDVSFLYWAPVVRVVNISGVEKLRMYYSVVIDNYIKSGKKNTSANYDGSWTERAFIGMCESTDPDKGVWEDKGFVTCSSTDRGRDGWKRSSTSDWNAYFYYNAIDPTYIVTPEGEHWLIHGSWHSGFASLQLDPASGKPLNSLGSPWATTASSLQSRFGRRVATRNSSRWQGSEAPEVIYHDGYYYLFMAYDGLDVPYNTRVARATSVSGPYVDILGTDITSGGECYPIVTHPYKFSGSYGWVGISHCCAFHKSDDENQWFYMSQGRLPANAYNNAYSNALMMGHVRRLVWAPSSASNLSDRWPIALPERYAAVPDYGTLTADSLVGEYEHINLTYKYGKQCEPSSKNLVLNADGSMSGCMTGSWSFDPSSNLLTLGNVVVCVERELDWEASPRHVTLVYAGIGSDKKTTLWGKKILK